MTQLAELKAELEPFKNTLVIDAPNEVVRLVDVIEEEDDYFWVYERLFDGICHSSCVMKWIPLKGYLPEEEYIRMVEMWNLNSSNKAT